jgi:hypothetical protein
LSGAKFVSYAPEGLFDPYKYLGIWLNTKFNK